MVIGKVDKSKARTACEEYWHVYETYCNMGNKLLSDMHPNQVKAMDVRAKRLINKMELLLASDEYKEYN